VKVGDLVKIKGGASRGRPGLLALVVSDGEKIWDGTPIYNVRVVEPCPMHLKALSIHSRPARIVDRYLEQNLELISESR
jgi:hypothetical protein